MAGGGDDGWSCRPVARPAYQPTPHTHTQPTHHHHQPTKPTSQAAAKGHPGAMGDMGLMYALGSEAKEGPHGLPVRGLGLPQDLDLVRCWFVWADFVLCDGAAFVLCGVVPPPKPIHPPPTQKLKHQQKHRRWTSCTHPLTLSPTHPQHQPDITNQPYPKHTHV